MSNNITYDQLSKITKDGFSVADYPQIRTAVINRMKEIYGYDIDVSSASADGQFVNMISLIINNAYFVLSTMYNNLNPETAGGKYLDTLCALTNIIRQTKTYSTASIIVKNISTTDQTPEFITCIDKVGVEWTWQNPLDGENLSTTYSC